MTNETLLKVNDQASSITQGFQVLYWALQVQVTLSQNLSCYNIISPYI